jgi:hypothetical protein
MESPYPPLGPQMVSLPGLSSPPLCRTFTDQSQKIWRDLSRAQVAGLRRGEETITEVLLQDIHDAHPREVVTFPFNKREEGFTGADWEWWLTDDRLWLGLLIQAKRLDPKSHKYPGMKHKSQNAPASQIDLLLDQANSKAIDPIYCFYNYSPSWQSFLSWNCCSDIHDTSVLGCTVAHAGAVKRKLDRGGAGLPKLSTISYPVSCLVCCSVRADPDASLPGRAYGVTKRLRAWSGDDGDRVALGHGPRDEPPGYVRRLLECPPEERERVIEELRSQVGPIGTLVVIRERRER